MVRNIDVGTTGTVRLYKYNINSKTGPHDLKYNLTGATRKLAGVRTYVRPGTYVDAPTAHKPGEQVPSQVQAHMLARIVVEIRAADATVELEP